MFSTRQDVQFVEPADSQIQSLGSLSGYTNSVDLYTPFSSVIKEFEMVPNLPGIMIYGHDGLVGLFSRRVCFERLSRPFGLELFLKKPVIELFSIFPHHCEVFRADTLIEDAVPRALSRPGQACYDPIVVDFGDDHLSIIDIHDLLLAQSRQLKESNRKNQEQIDLGQKLSQTMALAEASTMILNHLMGVISFERGLIVLNTLFGLTVPASIGFSGNWSEEHCLACAGEAMPLDQITTLRTPVLRTRGPNTDEEDAVDWAVNAWLFYPLFYSNSLIAVIALNKLRRHDSPGCLFERADINQIASFSSWFAIAIRNAQLYSEVQAMSITDALTQIHNRRGLIDRMVFLSGPDSPYLPVSILLVDIDHFKLVNDTYGHSVGDEILLNLAFFMTDFANCIENVGRLGGDEFLIILPNTSLESAVSLANQLIVSVTDKVWNTSVGPVSITISIGVASREIASKENTETLLQKADRVLYTAKQLGRNRVGAWRKV